MSIIITSFFSKILTKIIPYKWLIIGIAFALVLAFAGIQTMRISSFKSDVALLEEKIEVYKDNEIKYTIAIDTQKEQIVSLKTLVRENEDAFKNYVAAQKEKNDILNNSTNICVEPEVIVVTNTITKEVQVPAKVVVVDTATSDKMKVFFNDQFRKLTEELSK